MAWFWRCVLCGRFMRHDAEVVDVSHANCMAFEPPDPEWAHVECARDADDPRPRLKVGMSG